MAILAEVNPDAKTFRDLEQKDWAPAFEKINAKLEAIKGAAAA